MCNKSLKDKPYKILKRGKEGFEYDVCMTCFGGIMQKGGPDKYLPGKKASVDLADVVLGKDSVTGAKLHSATGESYAPIGAPKLDGEVTIAINNRTGQLIL
jgi:hypothetical protein